MLDPQPVRPATVIAGDREFSGSFLTPALVLTAAHPLEGHRVTVTSPDSSGPVACDVVWRHPTADAALLRLREPGSGPVDVRWADLPPGETVRCSVAGPRSRREGLLSAPATRWLAEAAAHQVGRAVATYLLELLDTSESRGGGPSRPATAAWAGAAVFTGIALAGVITAARTPAPRRIEVTPVRTLLADSEFVGVLREHGCPVPPDWQMPVTDPDADFERTFAEYVVDCYDQIALSGLDLSGEPVTWPLEATYLELLVVDESEEEDGTGTSVEQALAGRERVLLRGGAGAGKTTLLRRLALAAARRDAAASPAFLHGLVPFLLPVPFLVREPALPRPDELLHATGSPQADGAPPGWVHRVLGAGRGLMLVDGIDRVRAVDRHRIRAWLNDLIATFPGNRWIVTSRPSAVAESWLAPQGFTELVLAPMTRRDVQAFVHRWFEMAREATLDARDRARVEDLRESLTIALATRRELAGLATSPLMCALLCANHVDRGGRLPTRRMDLYRAVLEMLLSRRDEERGIGAPEGVLLSVEEQTQLLQRIAYWLVRNLSTEISAAHAVALIEGALPAMPRVAGEGDAERILRHLLARSGLLTLRGESVGFVHRTFQDYLAARAAVEVEDIDLLVSHAHEEQWQDVVRLAVGHARSQSRAKLLDGLVARGDAKPEHRARLHLLAAACLEYAVELDPTVRHRVERRAAALVPPHGLADALALAKVGPLVLELLPGPETIDPYGHEAAMVVRTAELIGGEAAELLIRRFPPATRGAARAGASRVPGPSAVPTVPVESWTTTPGAAGPARRVACRGDTTDFSALRALPLLHTLTISGNTSLTRLDEVLRGLKALRTLVLSDCPGLRDLSAVARTGVVFLEISPYPGAAALAALARSRWLRAVYLPGLGADCPEARELAALLPGVALFAGSRIPAPPGGGTPQNEEP
ncbi:NACHT domain-containing protein [Streptomyces triculaminicus]|uniref:NACHT domain-containing protein n=2 Tax=Streptomyces TaxID=1883 RepID=A0A939FP23_9ACTN|nr:MULTISPECIES: NACHT domain-containing protein [Streptomyces]MBO0655786.1 NACHT domain-containing protein [Streptomyces triculaminicus]QSY49807.1 NACHT domain-containing protein [Streptomyces griseocarneus]